MAELLDQQCKITAELFGNLPAVVQMKHGEEDVSLPTTRQLVAWKTIGRLSTEEKDLLLADVLRDKELQGYLPDEIELFMGATARDSLLMTVVANKIDDPSLLVQEDRNLDQFEARHGAAA